MTIRSDTAIGVKRSGGVRWISPPMRCPYCGRVLDTWCKARKVRRWGPVQFDLIKTICRSARCSAQARKDGYLS